MLLTSLLTTTFFSFKKCFECLRLLALVNKQKKHFKEKNKIPVILYPNRKRLKWESPSDRISLLRIMFITILLWT